MQNFGYKFDVPKVKRLMLEQGMSYKDFGDVCGYERSQVSYLMRKGSAMPNTLKNIADGLGVAVADILIAESNENEIKVMLDEGAKMPTRAHDGDAGLDFYSREDWFLLPGESHEFDTGVHIQIPKGYVGDVKSKSGLMMEYDILTDGTVDYGYTGAIRVKLFNHGKKTVNIQNGQKIAQLVIKKIITPKPVLASSFEETERGANGFGSSGIF